MVGRPPEFDGGMRLFTFYGPTDLAKLASRDLKNGEFSRHMRRLAFAYYNHGKPADRLRRELQDKEEESSRLQHDIDTIKVQLERVEAAATEAKRLELVEAAFRSLCRQRKGDEMHNLRNWLHKERADVGAIGWHRAKEIFTEETGVAVTW